jgi:hypothetical protein
MKSDECQACSDGQYSVFIGLDEQRQLQNKFGIGGAAPGKVVVLRCTECGHMQWFYNPPEEESKD